MQLSGVHVGSSWATDSAEFVAAHEQLAQRNIDGLQLRLEVAVAKHRRARVDKERLAQHNGVRRISAHAKRMQRLRKAVADLLDELQLWREQLARLRELPTPAPFPLAGVLDGVLCCACACRACFLNDCT